MGKDSPDPPQPVQIDPRKTAAAQFEYGQKAALLNKQLAESTFQETPYGSLRYETVTPESTSRSGSLFNRGPSITTPPVTKMIQELHPAEQRLLDQQRELKGRYGDVAGQLMGKAGDLFGTPIDTSSLGPMPGLAPSDPYGPASSIEGAPLAGMIPPVDASSLEPVSRQSDGWSFDMSSLGAMPQVNEATRQSMIDAITQRYQPQQAADRSRLETQLANQGFVRGSAAWDSAMDQINRRENDFRLAANLQAGGEMRADLAQQMGIRGQSLQELLASSGERRAERGQSFAERMGIRGQDLQELVAGGNIERANIAQQMGIRQQGLQEKLLPRTQTLQEMSTFMSGSQPTMPQFAPVSSPQVNAPDYAGLVASNAQMQNQANMAAYNAQMQNQGGGLGGLLGTAAGAFMGGSGGAALGSSISSGLGSLFGSGAGGVSTFTGAMPGGVTPGGAWSF